MDWRRLILWQCRQLNFSNFLSFSFRILDQRLIATKWWLDWHSVPFGNVTEQVRIVHCVNLSFVFQSQRVNWLQFFGPLKSKNLLIEVLRWNRRFFLSVIPADNPVVPSWCKDQIWISLTPFHSVNAFCMASVENGNRAFLVSQIPDLQLVSLLIIQCYGQLSWDGFAPTNTDISVAYVRGWTVLKLENWLVGLDVPKSNQAILTGWCQNVSNFPIPRDRCDIWAFMRISVAWFLDLRLRDVFANV